MTETTIGVIGAGAWGTALAIHLAKLHPQINLWARNPEALEKIISDIINEIDAEGMKDMGKVMGMASSKLSGKEDGKTISNIVRAKLN